MTISLSSSPPAPAQVEWLATPELISKFVEISGCTKARARDAVSQLRACPSRQVQWDPRRRKWSCTPAADCEAAVDSAPGGTAHGSPGAASIQTPNRNSLPSPSHGPGGSAAASLSAPTTAPSPGAQRSEPPLSLLPRATVDAKLNSDAPDQRQRTATAFSPFGSSPSPCVIDLCSDDDSEDGLWVLT